MAIIKQSRIWTQQPQNAVRVDLSHPLGANVEAFISAGAGVFEAVSGRHASAVGAGVKIGASKAGLAYQGFDGTTNAHIEFSFMPLLGPQIQKTWILAGVCVGSTAVGKAWFTNNYWNIVFLAGGNVRLTHIGIGDYVLASGIITAGVPCNIVITQDSPASVAAVYKDGKFVAQVASDNNSGGTNSGGNFRIGRNTATSAPLTTGDSLSALIQLGKAATRDEGISLSANPWQLAQPIQRRIWVNISAPSNQIELTNAIVSVTSQGFNAAQNLDILQSNFGMSSTDFSNALLIAMNSYACNYLTQDLGMSLSLAFNNAGVSVTPQDLDFLADNTIRLLQATSSMQVQGIDIPVVLGLNDLSLNQLISDKLSVLGFNGVLGDKLLSFFRANGAVSSTLRDAEKEWLTAAGAVGDAVQDMYETYLEGLGYVGSLADKLKQYWKEL